MVANKPFKNKTKNVFFKLHIVNVENKPFNFYSSNKSLNIGREPPLNSDFKIGDKKISKIHAKIFYSNSEECFFIRCLSKNGLIVNGNFLTSHCHPEPLQSCSLIQISNFLIYFLLPAKNRDFNMKFITAKNKQRLKDMFVFLTPEINFVPIEKFVVSNFDENFSLPVRSAFEAEPEMDLNLVKILAIFVKNGFCSIDSIVSDLKKNQIDINNDKALTLSLQFLVEIARLAFLKGDFESSKKLNKIIREINQCLIFNKESLFLEKDIKSAVKDYFDIINLSISRIALKLSHEKVEKSAFLKLIESSKFTFWNSKCDLDLLNEIQSTNHTDLEALINWAKKIKPEAFSEKNGFRNLISTRIDAIIKASIIAVFEKNLCGKIFDNFVLKDGKENFNKEWTVNEHFELCKILMIHGKPQNWSDFNLNSKLLNYKSKQQISERCDQLIQVAKDVLKKGSSNNYFGITIQGSKNLLERIEIFRKIRKIVNEKTFSEKLKAFQNHNNTPPWWNNSAFDDLYIKGVCKYGLVDWAKIAKENDSPISSSLLSAKESLSQANFTELQNCLPKRFFQIAAFLCSERENFPKLGHFLTPNKANFSSDIFVKRIDSNIDNFEQKFDKFQQKFEPKNTEKIENFAPKTEIFGQKIENFEKNENFGQKTEDKNLAVLERKIDYNAAGLKTVFKSDSFGAKKINLSNSNGEKSPGGGFRLNTTFLQKLPVLVGKNLLLMNLGRVEFGRQSFHNLSYIFPIGFKTAREYTSYVDPSRKCRYINEIHDGNSHPIFSVTCLDDSVNTIRHVNPTMIWQAINQKIIQKDATKPILNPINGFERFGLTDGRVREFIEGLENSARCAHYKLSVRKIQPHFFTAARDDLIKKAEHFEVNENGEKNNVPPPPESSGV